MINNNALEKNVRWMNGYKAILKGHVINVETIRYKIKMIIPNVYLLMLISNKWWSYMHLNHNSMIINLLTI